MNENPEGMIATLTKTIKNNWRLLLVGVIILAIALNSSQSDNKSSTESENIASPTSQAEQSKQAEPNKPKTTTQTAENSTPTPTPTKTPETAAVAVDTNVISETAAKSEGVTHLARRAIKEYLSTSQETLSSEQKIYAEDYLSKKTGAKVLEVGEKIEFSTKLIKQGVEQAKGLNQKQIENLSKYVPLARNLN